MLAFYTIFKMNEMLLDDMLLNVPQIGWHIIASQKLILPFLKRRQFQDTVQLYGSGILAED